MDVSIVVPLSGDPDQALRCLMTLAAVPDSPAHEVVIVDDASVGLESLLARLEGDALVVSRTRRGGMAGSLRSALERATGELIVLLRDAPEVDADFLAPLWSALADPGVAAATAGAGEPVAAHAIAARRADLVAEPVPEVADELLLGALAVRLARRGTVVAVPTSRLVAVAPAAATREPEPGPGGRGLDRHPPGTAPELTVVIPTLDAASDRLRRCVRKIQAVTDVAYEIVVVDNGAPPQGFTAPVNAGLRAARGRFVVVCNDDVEVLPGWWPPLRAALDAGHPVVFPRTIDGATRSDFAAWCFALSRRTLEQHAVAPDEFLDPELVVWYQDTDLLARLRAAGTPPLLVEASRIRHGLSETVASDDPLLRRWIDRQIRHDRDAFEARHGTRVPGAAPIPGSVAPAASPAGPASGPDGSTASAADAVSSPTGTTSSPAGVASNSTGTTSEPAEPGSSPAVSGRSPGR